MEETTAFLPMELIRLVAQLTHSSVTEITGDRRFKPLVRARAVIAVVMVEKGLNYSSVARWLKIDRTTVKHHCDHYKFNYIDDMVAGKLLKAARKQFIGEGA